MKSGIGQDEVGLRRNWTPIDATGVGDSFGHPNATVIKVLKAFIAIDCCVDYLLLLHLLLLIIYYFLAINDSRSNDINLKKTTKMTFLLNLEQQMLRCFVKNQIRIPRKFYNGRTNRYFCLRA